MASVTRFGYEIVKVATDYITLDPEELCIETAKNRGKCVDEIQKEFNRSNDVTPDAYCTKFAWNVVNEAAGNIGGKNILPKSAGGWAILDTVKKKKLLRVDSVPAVGAFLRRNSSGGGHSGIVVKVDRDVFYSIEANSGFKFLDKKYEGVWTQHYNYSALKLAKFQPFVFIHTEEMFGTSDLVSVDYETFTDKTNKSSFAITDIILNNKFSIMGIAVLSAAGYFGWKYRKKLGIRL